MKLSLPAFLLFTSSFFNVAEGHGYLESPRSRNWYARQEGGKGLLPAENNHMSILRKPSNKVCGFTPAINYDDYRDKRGNPMPWLPQGEYTEGQEIDIVVHLTRTHLGHFEFYVCPDGNDSTQECMMRNPLTMVRDLKFDGPRDANYPERGYLGESVGMSETYIFKYRLPNGVSGDKVMLQWRYVTANSCLPRGYRDNRALIAKGWVGLQKPDCIWPLNWTGMGIPEQFFNCAEIKINKSGSPPTGTPPTATPPNPPTGGGDPTCGNGNVGNGKCETGCCSKWGWCGTSPEHCDTPLPPVPAPTKPTLPSGEGQGTCGNGSVGNGKCSDSNLCCSAWGWCGSSTSHCNVGTCGYGNRGNGVCRDSRTDCCSKWGWCGTTNDHCNH